MLSVQLRHLQRIPLKCGMRAYTSLIQKGSQNVQTSTNMNLAQRGAKLFEYNVGQKSYDPNRGPNCGPDKYNFFVNNTFSAFVDNSKLNITYYTYISGEKSSSTDQTGSKNTIDITELDILQIFHLLPQNLRLKLREHLIRDMHWLTGSAVENVDSRSIKDLIQIAPSPLGTHYTNIIFDLFLNKPSLLNKNIKVETWISREGTVRNIYKLTTYIHIKDPSRIRSFWNSLFEKGKEVPQIESPGQKSKNQNQSKPNQIHPSNNDIAEAYSILGLPNNSNETLVRTRFYVLSKLYHPDTHSDTKEFQRFNTAYQTLKTHFAK